MNISTAMVLIAFIGFFSSFAVIRVKNSIVQSISVLFVPLISSNILYWTPCLIESICDEYLTWATLFLVPMFFVGTTALFIGLYILKQRGKNES